MAVAERAEQVRQLILTSMRTMVRDLDAALATTAAAVALVDWFAEIERLAVAGKALAAGRAAAGDVWRAAGDRSAADWLAKRTGTTVGEARSVLDTAARVAPASATDAAFRAGELSLKQAEAVSAGAAADPAAEAALLTTARHGSLQQLRDDAARVRAAADPDPAARHHRIHRNRSWRRWTDIDGARCGAYRLTPEAAAILEAAAQPYIDTAIDTARRTGNHEPPDAHAADGLVAMAAATMHPAAGDRDDTEGRPAARRDGNGTDRDGDDHRDGPDTHRPRGDRDDAGERLADGDDRDDAGDAPDRDDGPDTGRDRPPRGSRGRRRLRDRRELIALVDLDALQRGHLQPGETCEIAGVGPVPIEVARRMFGDALLRIVIRSGVDIRTVVHTGRTANALQETAVLVRDRGRCIRPRCGQPITEIDHTTGYSHTGPVTLDDLAGLCGHDHDLKTRHGHHYQRHPDGTIRWTRPDGTIEERPPP